MLKEAKMTYWMMQDVVNFTRLSRSTIRRLEKKAAFPLGKPIVGRKRVWDPTDVRNWAEGILDDTGSKRSEKSSGILSKFR